MAIRDLKGAVDYKIPVKNVIVSVFDKSGLEDFIPGLMELNPDVRFMSTGGTYKRIREVLGKAAAEHLMEVAKYTEFPEMEGGLVKTLHPKIHAGLLGERHNPEHQRYLAEELDEGVFIDMAVVNLYPFQKVIGASDVTFEKARGNIDIGGPTMLRAAAKNFLGCAAVCNPQEYERVLSVMKKNNGCTTFELRLTLASNVFAMTAQYDKAIADYMAQEIHSNLNSIRDCYLFTYRRQLK